MYAQKKFNTEHEFVEQEAKEKCFERFAVLYILNSMDKDLA